MGKSVHAGHRQRVNEEFMARGFAGWPDHRVVEMLLFYAIPQGDVNHIAHALVNRFGSLAGVLDAPYEELLRVDGVGAHTATFLRMMSSVGAVYAGSRGRRDNTVHSAKDAAQLLLPYFFGGQNEMVYILCLDGKNQVLGVRKIAEGSIRAANINLRRIMEEVVALRGAKIYLAHNHVGSLALPSKQDWDSTAILYGSLNQVGIELVDHLVFQDDDMVSLRESQGRGQLLFPL